MLYFINRSKEIDVKSLVEKLEQEDLYWVMIAGKKLEIDLPLPEDLGFNDIGGPPRTTIPPPRPASFTIKDGDHNNIRDEHRVVFITKLKGETQEELVSNQIEQEFM